MREVRSNQSSMEKNSQFASKSRRSALRKLGAGGLSGAVLASLPEQWLKPVVEIVVLPAHADTTLPQCYSISVRVFDLTDTPASGGAANFKIEITSHAPDIDNQVMVSASVDNGTLVGTTSGDIYAGNSLIFAWTGPGVSGLPVPDAPTELTVDWVCADSQSGTSSYDLVDMVLTASAA